jgi:hypothetical protein
VQIHPLVPVKKAASALGVEKAVIRDLIDSGAIKGKRRIIRNKEKWFLYQGEFQDLIQKHIPGLTEPTERMALEGLQEFFDPNAAPTKPSHVVADEQLESADESIVLDIARSESLELESATGGSIDFEPMHSDSIDLESASGESFDFEPANEALDLQPANGEAAIIPESLIVTEVGEYEADHPDRRQLQTEQLTIDQMLHSLTIEFAHRLCEERQIICNLQQTLSEKNLLLENMPDLKQKLEDDQLILQNKDTEIATLKANIDILETDLAWWKKPWWSRMFKGANKA